MPILTGSCTDTARQCCPIVLLFYSIVLLCCCCCYSPLHQPPPPAPPQPILFCFCLESKQGAKGEETAAGANNTNNGTKGDGSSSVTYELFLKEASEAKRLFSKGGGQGENIPGVEARIAALEKALGGGDGGAKGPGGRGGGGVFGEGGEVRRT